MSITNLSKYREPAIVSRYDIDSQLQSYLVGKTAYELLAEMEENYYEVLELKDLRNRRLEEDAEKMRLSILGKDGKYKDDKPLSVVDAYISENTVELIDPLNVLDEIESLKDKHTTLLSELETKIKISNATTFIEIH